MLRSTSLALLGAAGCLIAGAAAHAAVINITYTATSFPDSTATSESGSGTITFTPEAGTPNNVALSDVTDFAFTLSQSDGTNNATTLYSIADLSSFSATLDGVGGVTSLTLSTDPFGFGNTTGYGGFNNQALDLSIPGSSSTDNQDIPATISSGVATASVQAAVPEPMTLSILGFSLAGLGLVRRRRR